MLTIIFSILLASQTAKGSSDQCGISGLCLGEVLQHDALNTRYECMKACRSLSECQWWSFSSEASDCFLLKICDLLDEDKIEYVSGEVQCDLPFSKALITTGHTDYQYLSETEVVDLLDETNKCSNLENYPERIYMATGGLIDGNKPLICGGFTDASCCVIGENKAIEMTTKRWESASLVFENRLWITGGSNGRPINTTEFISLDEGTIPGPNLPKELREHAMVKLNDTHAMVIGGSTFEGYSDETLIFDFNSQTWTYGPKLNQARDEKSAAILTDLVTRKKYVVVAGGIYESSVLDSVEILELPFEANEWIIGPSMPKELCCFSMLSLEDEVVVLGGYDDDSIASHDIFGLKCRNMECEWTQRKQKLKHAKSDFVAMLVPDEIVDCNH